jgi:Ca2+-binding RTX toxin-like protein
VLFGGNGRDALLGGPGDDRLFGGPRHDYLNGGEGDDHINSRDGIPERVLCGRGIDYVVADQFDTFVSCETGIVKPLPLPPRSLLLALRSGR